MAYKVSLTVGDVSVTGEGPSPQAARHDAAKQALEILQTQKPNIAVKVEGRLIILKFRILM